jgi:hydrogenase/urease accessory protein HupE
VSLWAGLVGAALIARADWLGKLTGFYDPDVPIFEGSILSSVGAALLLIAMLDAVRLNRSAATASASVSVT